VPTVTTVPLEGMAQGMCNGWPAGPAPSRFYSTPIGTDATASTSSTLPTIHNRKSPRRQFIWCSAFTARRNLCCKRSGPMIRLPRNIPVEGYSLDEADEFVECLFSSEVPLRRRRAHARVAVGLPPCHRASRPRYQSGPIDNPAGPRAVVPARSSRCRCTCNRCERSRISMHRS
jgi:hypothetical protein